MPQKKPPLDDWQDVADDWQDVSGFEQGRKPPAGIPTSPYKPVVDLIAKHTPEPIKKGWEELWKKRSTLPSRLASKVAEPMMQWGETHPGTPYSEAARYGGAFLQSFGNVSDEMTSIGNVALTAGSGGANMAARQVTRAGVSGIDDAIVAAKAAGNLDEVARLSAELQSMRGTAGAYEPIRKALHGSSLAANVTQAGQSAAMGLAYDDPNQLPAFALGALGARGDISALRRKPLPVRNLEAPPAELPPVKPADTLDASGRNIAPPQAELPVRPPGPWDRNKIDIAQELGTGDPRDPATRLGAEAFYDQLGTRDVTNDPAGSTWIRDPRASGPDVTPQEMANIVRGVKGDLNINVESFAGPLTGPGTDPPIVPIKKSIEEFVDPTTGEIIPAGQERPGNLPLQASKPTDVFFPPEAEKPLYHGTRQAYDQQTTKKGDKSDFLGDWMHFAEDPEHAARVAIEKDIPVGPDGLVSAENLDPATRPRPDFMTAPDSEVSGLNVRPSDVSRVNPLDITHSSLGNRMIQDAENLLKHIPMNSWGRMLLREAINSAKRYMRPDVISKGENLSEVVPQVARNLQDEMLRAVQNHPEIVKASGFDALRYIDQPGWGKNYSVAVPSDFQVKPSLNKPPVQPEIPAQSADFDTWLNELRQQKEPPSISEVSDPAGNVPLQRSMQPSEMAAQGDDFISMGIGDPKDVLRNQIGQYAEHGAKVATKELLQNSLDALKDFAGRPGNKVKILLDYGHGGGEPSITVSDNGAGLPIDLIRNEYTNLTASGKRGKGQYIGEMGVGKSTYLLSTDRFEVSTVAREPDGSVWKYEFGGTPNDMIDGQIKVNKTQMPPNTETGTSVTIFDKDKNNIDHAENYLKSFAKYSNPHTEVEMVGNQYQFSTSHNLNKIVQPRTVGPGKPVASGSAPGGDFDIAVPDTASWGEGNNIAVILMNRGMFQGVDTIYLDNTYHVPDRVTVDVNPTVPATDSKLYPLTSPTRERMKGAFKDAVKAAIDKDLVEAARKRNKDDIQAVYDGLVPDPGRNFVVHDSGDRYLPQELDDFKNSNYANVLSNVMDTILRDLDALHPTGQIGRTSKFGFLLSDSNKGGINVPNPGLTSSNEFAILINPFSGMEAGPNNFAQRMVHIITHEFNHNKSRGEGAGYTWELADTYTKYDLEKQLDAKRKILAAITDRNGNYAPEVQNLLQQHTAIRGRADTKPDLLSRARESEFIGGPEGEGIASVGSGQDGAGAIRLRELFEKQRAGTITPFEMDEARILASQQQAQQAPPVLPEAPPNAAQLPPVRSATGRMGTPSFGPVPGGELPAPPPNAAGPMPVVQPPTLNTNVLSRPATAPNQPWSPVGAMPTNQPPLPVNPAISPPTSANPPPYGPLNTGPRMAPSRPMGPARPPRPQMGPRLPPYQNPPGGGGGGGRFPPNPLVPQTPPPGGPIRATLSAHKAWLTSGDISAPGRQGKAFVFNKAWWTSLDDMFKAWGSKRGFDLVNDSIQNHPSGLFNRTTLPSGRQVKSWAEQMGLELPQHEEMFTGSAGKKFGEITGIERSSRAHTAFLNKLRSDQFASMIRDSQAAGIDPIRNQHIAKAYAKFINDATGRGSVNIGKWKLENNMQMMNDLFFAPKNMAGQIKTWNNILNPMKYYNYDRVLRKQALKSLFAVAGLGLGVGELARHAGAKVSNDPTSSDFRKVRLGDSRIDMFGGYQQFPVAAMKFMSGLATSTITGKTTDLTAGRFGQRTRKDVGESFFVNRLSPLASFIYAWMDNREFDGQPFEVKRAAFERVFPIAAKDIWELAQEDPALAAAMAPLSVTGFASTQHYSGR